MFNGRSISDTDTEVIDTASDWLKQVFVETSGDAIFTSPYVSKEICRQIADASRESAGSWKLVTSLDPSAVANGFLSVEGLHLLLANDVEIVHMERLHAKCFIIGQRGMLGSANLTGAGLGSSALPNRELGIELTSKQVSQALETISSWPAVNVEDQDLEDLVLNAQNLTQTQQEQFDELDALSALKLAEKILDDARDHQRSLWIKLEYGKPALEGWRKDALFASPKKGKPSFKPGDLVFICAQDTQDCYAVVEVTSQPEYQPADYLTLSATWGNDAADRWPWVNRTKPRLVPASLLQLKLTELGVSARGLQNGHIRLKFDEFTAGVRALARLASNS